MLPRRARELAKRGEHALNERISVCTATRGYGCKPRSVEHLAMLVVRLHQAIAVEEYGLTVSEGRLLLLVGATGHQP